MKISIKEVHFVLGSYPCSHPAREHRWKHAMVSGVIRERHRHRYEFNNQYREQLTNAGLVISGTSPEIDRLETVELPEHPSFCRSTVSSRI